MTQDPDLEAYNQYRAEHNLAAYAPKPDNRRMRNIMLSDEAWNGIKQLAITLGYHGPRGANLRAFMEALGRGYVDVTIKP